jgi:four helix bundle protein
MVLYVYKLVIRFPTYEQNGLSNQVRRSAVSVPANIIEGQGRHSSKENVRFLYISKASAMETNYHMFLAKDLGYITNEEYQEFSSLCTRVKMMLSKLIKSLEHKTVSNRPSDIEYRTQ